MIMKYKPEYAKGQILVGFLPSGENGFAEPFGEAIGYKLSKESYEHGNEFIFETPVGQEEIAIKKFKQYKEFVQWAGRRDTKQEPRWNGIEAIEEKLADLKDDVAISDEQFNTKRSKLIDMLKRMH